MGEKQEKLSRLINDYRLATLLVCLAVLVFILVIYPLLPLPGTFPVAQGPVMALLLALIIPMIFLLSSNSAYDRFIGDLSFGIYIVHYPILAWYQNFLPPELLFSATLASSVLAALILYLTVEKPVDQWRQRRAILKHTAA